MFVFYSCISLWLSAHYSVYRLGRTGTDPDPAGPPLDAGSRCHRAEETTAEAREQDKLLGVPSSAAQTSGEAYGVEMAEPCQPRSAAHHLTADSHHHPSLLRRLKMSQSLHSRQHR
uniref:Uncharacterized protein n=1 Tax=Knipowitschia caucasica TaxID=637954 RepID=A0AAV2J3L7_KNICA